MSEFLHIAGLYTKGNPDFTIDILLYCPNCAEQHIDNAEPNICQDCGHSKDMHNEKECRWSREDGGGMSGKLRSIEFCHCEKFNPWLNPPHKSHRCHSCNWVWRPSDVATNGVLCINTKGENDKSAQPSFYRTAKDFRKALEQEDISRAEHAWKKERW